jgi:YegS/Rv2252/BmrU family lipid kinase
MSASDGPFTPPFVEHCPKRYAVILNPRSGNGRAARQWERLEERVAPRLGDYEVFRTEGPGHGTELTRAALRDGFDRVISAGGDGTNFEVINGFFDGMEPVNPGASLALLPIGTASDLRKTYGLGSLDNALELLDSPRVVPVDVGRLESVGGDGAPMLRYFNTAVHIGLGSLVNEHVNRRSKALGGFLTFVLGVITARLAYTELEMTVEVDGETFTDRYLEVIVAKGFYDGGGMHVAPRGRLDNGLFEVYLIGKLGPLASLLNIPRMYRGTQDRHPAVRYLQAKRVHVTCAQPVRPGPDGETTGFLPATLEVVPRAIRAVTGPDPRAGNA